MKKLTNDMLTTYFQPKHSWRWWWIGVNAIVEKNSTIRVIVRACNLCLLAIKRTDATF